MSLKYLFVAALLLLSHQMNVQTPTVQDCLGAIPLYQSIYHQDSAFSGTGNFPDEISTAGCPVSCLLSGEKNDVWYIFTVQSTGNLCFNIIPNSSSDDYDWAVFNLTDATCADIYSDSSLMVSCNYSPVGDTTGANGLDSISCASATDGKYNALIPVVAGETFVLNISNFSATQSGYTLDFSCTDTTIFTSTPTSKPPGKSVTLSPNPVDNIVTLTFESDAGSEYLIVVYDIAGKPVLETKVTGISGSKMQKFDLYVSDLPTGSYYVVISAQSKYFQRAPLMIVR